MRLERAVLACDDRGTVSPSSSNRTYALGGFASATSDHTNLASSWQSVKEQLCGSTKVELKWSHFFPGHHQLGQANPLRSSDPDEWRRQALWALRRIFAESNAFPITTVVRKSEVNEAILAASPKGKEVIDTSLVFASVLGQFALYLKQYQVSRGKIWFDRLGSLAEEDRFQKSIDEFFDSLDTSPIPKENIRLTKRIDPQITFQDSSESEIIQIADFVSGVIWAAAEGDTWFLRELLEEYAPGGRRTYGIVVIEK